MICSFTFVTYSCKSLHSKDTITPEYDFKYDLYSHVKWYYRANLKYPSVNDLFNYYWKIVNEANNNKFSSYNDFNLATQKNVTGRENLLHNLSLYKDKIAFRNKNKSMDIFLNGRKWMTIEFDLCEMIKEKSPHFTYFYDTSCNHYKDFDYENCFYNIRKEIREDYLTDTLQWSKTHLCLLRYNRDKGYEIYCPSNCVIIQNAYLNKLGCALDTFLLNRDIQMIQFVTNLPDSYFMSK